MSMLFVFVALAALAAAECTAESVSATTAALRRIFGIAKPPGWTARMQASALVASLQRRPQLEIGNAQCQVESDLAFDGQRLQGHGFVGAADQGIGADADAD